MLPLYGAVMHIACALRFRRICALTVVTCATCLPATVLVACGANHTAAEAPALPRGTSPTLGAASASADAAGVAAGGAAIAATMRGAHRTPGAAGRDKYRHPVETLALFGFTPTMTVLDIGPGWRGQGLGYYTELLAPVLANDGLYLATNREPPSSAPEPSTHHWTAYEACGLTNYFARRLNSTGRFR